MMMTFRVTVVCFLTIAACIAGIYAQDNSAQPVYQCGIDFCTKCDAKSKTCVGCDKLAGYTLDSVNNNCTLICPYVRGCLVCADTDEGDHICLQCMRLWGMTEKGQCVECGSFSGCSRCTNTSVCDMCVDANNMGPKRDGKSAECGPCGKNGRRCFTNGAGLCDQCIDGSQDPFEGICTCADNCAGCTNNGWSGCDKCKPGYGLAVSPNGKNKCQECPANCDNCDQMISGQCATCSAGFGLDTDFICKNCETPNICSNHGNCRSTSTGFLCSCEENFTGVHCEAPKK